METRKKDIPMHDALNFGWSKFKSQPLVWIGLVLIMAVISGLLTKIFGTSNETGLNTLRSIVNFLVDSLVAIGMTTIALNVYKGKKAEFNDFFSNLKPYGNFLLTSILLTLLVGAIFILMMILLLVTAMAPAVAFVLAIVAVIWAINLGLRYQFATFAVIDKNMTAIEALKHSSEITKNVRVELFVFDCLLFLILIVSLIPFLLGLLISIPVLWLAQIYVYKKLSEHTDLKSE